MKSMDVKEAGLWMKLLSKLDEALEQGLKWAWRNRRVLVVAAGLLLAGWAMTADEAAPEPERVAAIAVEASDELLGEELFGRLWIDKAPQSHKDKFRMYFFLKDDKHPIGVHLTFHSMTYRVQEFFAHDVKGKKIHFHFPDPGVKPSTKVAMKKIDKQHFDMKMVMETDPQAKGVKYSYLRLKERAAQDLLAGYGVSVQAMRAQLLAAR